MDLSCRIQELQALIAAHARYPVTLVAASKMRSAQEINLLPELGVMDYGENRVQEWLEKREEIRPEMRFHMIGRLQSNKAVKIANEVALVHSLDRSSLARVLDKEGARAERRIPVLIEVSIAGESQKGGVPIHELDDCVQAWKLLPWIEIKGLMVLAPLGGGAVARDVFRRGKEIWDRLSHKYETFEVLSMGMSGDFIEALEEGSNMIRIGSALFGAREQQIHS